MQTSPRPELAAPVRAFAARLGGGERQIPLAALAELFGAPASVLALVQPRGDLVFRDETFSNDGRELVVPAGRVELEMPSLIRGRWHAAGDDFSLAFGAAEFAPAACVKVAVFRKCFALRELRADATAIELDFGNSLADRRYTF